VLSFVAAFLGSWLARSADTNEARRDADADVRRDRRGRYEEALEEILPAGSAVRAGTGVPEAGKGYEGDVYIDISTPTSTSSRTATGRSSGTSAPRPPRT
jgi:hypothetical protein